MIYALLLFSLVIILIGAEIFTNGIEWLGKKLHLGEGAVGSILAAVGTALPETTIPVIAILFGSGEDATHIGIGAILGAPFMLATLAMFVTGTAAALYRINGEKRTFMLCDSIIMRRDLSFFILVYTVALLAAYLPSHKIKLVVAAFLVLAYAVYAYHTIRAGETLSDADLEPLIFRKSRPNPSSFWVLLQVGTALAIIIIGARAFVNAISTVSTLWGVPAFVLAVIIAPVATELPEKFNSIVWVRQGKDTLALGNITGAMVFQSSVIPALGILLTPWELSPLALLSGALALASAAAIYLNLRLKNRIRPRTLIGVGTLYIIFFAAVVFSGGGLH
ncbi:MAG: sodium:calcium antiporter [Peptococcaceae bacterium]|jgi:cation:H+ antiporter|nr:sodium:calcium antiporter [Peptococcaceae bacterium]MDH7524254.1 sodium:calcium antiporter [Peptococcaceae bacterium]